MNIVVLAGGTSTERDVSLSSGNMIYRALKKNGHRAILLDVYLGYDRDDIADLFTREEDWSQVCTVTESDPDCSRIRELRADGGRCFFGPRVLEICQMADLVFLALHGANGEDGKVQAAFDLFGIRYTGADYLGSALAMDKELTKELFAQHRIPTPESVRLCIREALRTQVNYPAVVKVCRGGSSVGVYIVHNREEYEAAVRDVERYDDRILVERYIAGREFSVGVIDGKALPVIEIAPISGFYDYKNKYQEGSAVETCPAELPPETAARMQTIAERVFSVLHLSSYARMDFMMDAQERIYCLEANTLPGMTPTSLLPQEAACLGMDFAALCEKLIQVSLARYEEQDAAGEENG